MLAQEFVSSWPAVLSDIQEYVALTHLSVGRGRPGHVSVRLSKRRVAANELQPHTSEFRRALRQQLPSLRLTIAAADIPAHRGEVHY